MRYEIMKALDDPNGVTQDMWLSIISVVGDRDPSVHGASCFGGRYYITEAQRNRLRHMIPFLNGDNIAGAQPILALPPHIEEVKEHPDDIRCGRCKGPFHPASGHAFSAIVVACGPCYGKFAAWQLQKYGWKPLTSRQQKKMNKKKAKDEKRAEKAAKALEKQAAKEAAEKEKKYGKPREAQSAILEH